MSTKDSNRSFNSGVKNNEKQGLAIFAACVGIGFS